MRGVCSKGSGRSVGHATLSCVAVYHLRTELIANIPLLTTSPPQNLPSFFFTGLGWQLGRNDHR